MKFLQKNFTKEQILHLEQNSVDFYKIHLWNFYKIHEIFTKFILQN